MNGSTLAERTVVVTGATRGLGLEAARALAVEPGVSVVLAVRDTQRGATVAAGITGGRAGTGAVVALPLDLADLASVRAFPGVLAAAGLPPLHALVANAGIQYRDRRHTTADGYEATFGVNHLGHFLLVRLLLPVLADDGRVVIVASGTHKARRVRNFGFPPPQWRDPRELATPGPGSGQVAYATSKLANVMTMLELQRRIDAERPGAAIAVHGLDPGLMPATDLSRDFPAPVARLYKRLTPVIERMPGATSTAASGAQLARMAVGPDFAGPGGRYIELTADGAPSAAAREPGPARELWDVSEELTAPGAPRPA